MSSGSSPITPLTPAQTEKTEQQVAHENYIRRCLVGVDQMLNVLTDGDPDETISSRAARAAEKGKKWGIEMSRFLNLLEKDHGAKAQAGDVERAQTVVSLEDKSGSLPNG